MVVRSHPEKKLGEGKDLHVWLGGDDRTRAMLLLFAQMLTAQYRWNTMQITVFDTAGSDEEKHEAEARLQRQLREARIDARSRVVLRQGRTVQEIMHVESNDADFALVGIEIPDEPDAGTEGYRELLDGRERECAPDETYPERVRCTPACQNDAECLESGARCDGDTGRCV